MQNRINRFISSCLAAGAVILLAACGQNNDATAAAAEFDLLDSIQLLDTYPANALAVTAARQQLKPGDAAVVFGRIGGAVEPFVAGYAAFVLADSSLLFCDQMGEDHCATPWDACCEDPDKLQAGRASVQFVDAAGDPLASSLKGYAGLAPFQPVVVAGKVAAASTPNNLIIEARALYAGGPDR